MDRRDFLRCAGLGLLALPMAKAAATPLAPSPKRPNILWIILDDGRADAVGCYGKSWARTPHIDALAASGVRFETAIVQSPVCVPSRRSMKTGHYAHEIGPVAMGRPPEQPGRYIDAERMDRLDQAPNLLDAFADAYGKPVNVGKIHGFGRCWDHRGDAPLLFDVLGRPTAFCRQKYGDKIDALLDTPRVFTPARRWQIGGVLAIPPEDTETWRLGDLALETLDELAGQEDPFFLRVSFHAPHVACYVPEAYYIDPATIDLPVPTQEELDSKPRFERGPLRAYSGGEGLTPGEIDLCRGTYYGMLALVDTQVGRLIQRLEEKGLLDDTVIAFTSDQGFQLGEHGMWKKRVFYEQNVCVPLILNQPGRLPAGKVIDEPVELIDFLPTMMDLAGLDVPEDIRGRSLMPLIEGQVQTWRAACFCELDHSQSMYDELRDGTGRRVMARTREWKLIFFMDERVDDPDGALYHLAKDPGETVNRYDDPECRDVIAELRRLARLWDEGRLVPGQPAPPPEA